MTDSRSKPWDQSLREAGARIDEDLKRLVAYLNDEVVPDVRRSGSSALRSAAAELQRLAERMDDRVDGGPTPSARTSSARPGETVE